MKLNEALEVFEYNKAMLTCDMSISRDPEHQDVSPDYYGKDAEDLYYAIVCVENYIKKSIPIERIEQHIKELDAELHSLYSQFYSQRDSKEKNDALLKSVELRTTLRAYETVLSEWRKENENDK